MVQTVEDSCLSSLLVLHPLKILINGLCKHRVTGLRRLLSNRVDLHCIDNTTSLCSRHSLLLLNRSTSSSSILHSRRR